MDVSAFDFDLPEELIAQEPPAQRGGSRLLVLHRNSGRLDHASFHELPQFLTQGDLLVLNDTRVFPARLLGHRMPSGGAVECLLIRQLPTPHEKGEPTPHQSVGPGYSPAVGVGEAPTSGAGSSEIWEALMHPGQKLKPGAAVVFEGGDARIDGEVLERRFFGRRTIRLWTQNGDLADAINRIGHIPLPPYIRRDDRPADRERYQTVYANERGSIAAPTAGLHFTEALLQELADAGVEQARVTLHVGYGTFKPVRVDRVEDHAVDAETFSVSEAVAEQISRARKDGRRIIAVGTTTARALESLTVTSDGRVLSQQGETSLFIRPGHRFRSVGGLITNFHLPKSSLLMLVSAFAGHEQVMAAYRAAVSGRYRFYSYGDAMLIL
ncbi:MAG TPA: tRNA preQ1(34) S-adenosylmethionine ribosyltransferase-isomerase QueA [Vicinamibacterales bacterium]|jgi:S-adenosylmethionine:tRNA ribosyltransferase-isomerase|nr:tRNA preQ1(34) S-adenosylmethionine ribosyltransferase-isomerase QueA [Vicinamibacterales bacterium]